VPLGTGLLSETNFRKLKQLDALRKTGNQLLQICTKMQGDQEVYELIRIYADIAQEIEFDYLHKILKDSDAQNLMSKLLKLERWSVILIFYFKVMKRSDVQLDSLLKKLSSEVWKSHVYLITWIKMLKIFGNLSHFNIDLHDEFLGTRDDLVVQIVGVCSLIQSYIRKL
jgi:hypothetical protein